MIELGWAVAFWGFWGEANGRADETVEWRQRWGCSETSTGVGRRERGHSRLLARDPAEVPLGVAGLVPSPDAPPWASGGWTGLRPAGQGRGRGIGWGAAQKGGPGGGAWGGTWPQGSEALARLTWSLGRFPPSPAVCGVSPSTSEPPCLTARWGDGDGPRQARAKPPGKGGSGWRHEPPVVMAVTAVVTSRSGDGFSPYKEQAGSGTSTGLVLGPTGPNPAFVSV